MLINYRENFVHVVYYKDEDRYACYSEDDDIYRWPYYNDDIVYKANRVEKISDNIYSVYCFYQPYWKEKPLELGKALIKNYLEYTGEE